MPPRQSACQHGLWAPGNSTSQPLASFVAAMIWVPPTLSKVLGALELCRQFGRDHTSRTVQADADPGSSWR